ncbi:MAG: hypothetical protein ABIR54_12340 [Burkholderiaceae bacterium]
MRQGLLHSVAPILAAPWQQRRSAGSLWGLFVVVAFVAIGPVAMFGWSLFEQFGTHGDAAGSQHLHLVRLGLAVSHAALAADLRHSAANITLCALAVLALGWWAVTVSNVFDQNRAVLARLVPEHPTRLRAALLVAWVGMVAFVTLLVGVRFDIALACAATSAATFALVAVAMRWPLVWMTGCLAPIVVNYVLAWPALGAVAERAQALWFAQGGSIFVTVAAASAVLLVSLVQAGGKRHAANDEARRNRVQRFQMRARGSQPVAVGVRGALDTALTRPYYAWWRFVSTRPVTPVFSRVMLALGPSVHWTAGLSAVFGGALAVAVAMLAAEAIGLVFPGVAAVAPDMLASVSIGLMFGLLSPVLQLQARLHQTRREQALLMLLPGVPRGAALNRRLAWQLTAQFLATWLGAVALMGLCLGVANVLHPGVLRSAILGIRDVMVVATLPLVVLQWRPWARVSAPTTLNAMGAYLLGGLVGLVAWIAPLIGWLSLATVATAAFAAALAWCAMRWVRLGRDPSAFPVGRLA